jgi:hypothetical protein
MGKQCLTAPNSLMRLSNLLWVTDSMLSKKKRKVTKSFLSITGRLFSRAVAFSAVLGCLHTFVVALAVDVALAVVGAVARDIFLLLL